VKTIVLNCVGCLLSAAFCILIFEPFNQWYLAIIALLPFLLVLERTKGLHYCFLYGLLFGTVFFAGALLWFTKIFGLSSLALYALLGLYIAGFALCYKLAAAAEKPWQAIIVGASAWVGIEWLRCEAFFLSFSWLTFGQSQVRNLPSLQYASWIGEYGLSLLIAAANIRIAQICLKRFKDRNKLAIIVLVCSVSLYEAGGWYMLYATEKAAADTQQENQISVALVQDENNANYSAKKYHDPLIDAKADFIVWPELSFASFVLRNELVLDEMKGYASEYKSTLLFGCKTRVHKETAKPYYNSVAIMDKSGDLIGVYHKHFPIQFFDDGEKGDGPSVYSTPKGQVGILICYDLDHSFVVREIINNGAEFLFCPALDARQWTAVQFKQHAALTRIRAVESGRWIGRAATLGISQIVSPSGRVIKQMQEFEQGVLTGSMSRANKRTWYMRIGWRIPYACVSIFLGFFVWSIARRSKT